MSGVNMSSIICSVEGCYNNLEKRNMFLAEWCFEHYMLSYECCGPAFNLHPPPSKKEQREEWLKALNLKRTPQRPYVCSFHFVEGQPTPMHPYPEKCLGYGTHLVKPKDGPTNAAVQQTDSTTKSDVTFWESRHMVDHNYAARHLLDNPLCCDKGTQCHGTSEIHMQLLRNNCLSLLYTGLPLDAFSFLTEQLTRDYINNFQLNARDQILMTLMKLRLNLLQDDLAERFCVSQPEVTKIITLWLDVMEKRMRGYIPWLPRETIQTTMPQLFREHYPLTTCVIDCLETPLQKPCTPTSRGKSHSHYYSHNSIKYLVAIAPCGLIMFISIAYGGRCSDKYIMSDSGFLQYLRPGDVVIAQRGFVIEELLHERKVKLLPALTKDGMLLLSKENTTGNNNNLGWAASIESVIHRLKKFRVISEIVPLSLADKFDKILRICAALCNLHADKVEDNEFYIA